MTEEKNIKNKMLAVVAAMVAGLVIYFGYGFEMMTTITKEEHQRLKNMVAKVPELAGDLARVEKDGKVTSMEYWEVIDAYKRKLKEDYEKELEKKSSASK